MQFHNVRFSTEISFGTLGGPERAIDIVSLANGQELRNARQKFSRRKYLAGSGVKSLAQLYEIQAFFEARMGKLHGFRWKDWTDYKSSQPDQPIGYRDQLIGYGDDVKRDYQLVKTYPSGGFAGERKITKPISHTVRVGIEQRECDKREFQVDPLSGRVRFAKPPENGARVFAGFEFDVPVRFDCDQLQINLAHFEAGEIPNIPVVEIME